MQRRDLNAVLVDQFGIGFVEPAFFQRLLEQEGAWILDTRSSAIFTEGFVPGSISIGLDGRFAEWAGSLLPFDKPMLLVTEPDKEKETIVRLARVGQPQHLGRADRLVPS